MQKEGLVINNSATSVHPLHICNEPHEEIKDGYVKYNCVWTQSQPVDPHLISHLNEWRQKLYNLNLIGAYPNKVGFGNVSIRIPNTHSFIVSGTETGNISKLNESNYSIVTNVDIDANTLYCTGPCRASSEAMTHAAAYYADQTIMAIVHCHSPTMWKNLYAKIPTTKKSASYGTPQIAHDVERVVKKEKKRPLMIVMGGHETGMLCVGGDIESVGQEYVKHYKRLKLSPTRT